MKDIKWYWWLPIIFLAIFSRFYHFTQNVYFGFDEARDAFVSQAIYTQGDIKLIGPPTNGVTGLNHGVLHWYLTGILYLLGSGSPYFVAAIFRLLNALAILPIFWITEKLLGKRAAYLAALLFAVSFESSQYAMYYGNPSLAVWSWISLFGGAVILLKSKNKFWGLPLMALGVASGAQFEIFLVTLIPLAGILLLLLKKEIPSISLKSRLTAILLGLSIFSSYILGEFKNGFRSLEIVTKILTTGYRSSNDPAWLVFLQRWILMWHDNFWPWSSRYLWPMAVGIVIFWFFQARKKIEYRLLLTWIFGGILILVLGSYNAYFINVGIGTGLIIGFAGFLDRLWDHNKVITAGLIILAMWGNLSQILVRNKEGLMEDIKTQQFMLLQDEIKVMEEMYDWAGTRSFTVRATTMPYKIQTVWAYLFTQYGKKKYHYLPYYETGNALGFPGELPVPKKGSTCVRFLMREPYGGIPRRLIDADTQEENLFSKVVETTEIGHFYLEKRLSKAKDCLTNNYP